MKTLIVIIIKMIFIFPVTVGVLALMNWGIVKYMEWFISLEMIGQWFIYVFTFPFLFLIAGVLIGATSCLFAWGNVSKWIIGVLTLLNSIYMMYVLWDSEHIVSSIEILFQALLFTFALMSAVDEGTELAYPNNRRKQ